MDSLHSLFFHFHTLVVPKTRRDALINTSLKMKSKFQTPECIYITDLVTFHFAWGSAATKTLIHANEKQDTLSHH